MLADRQSITIPKPNNFAGFSKAGDSSAWPDRRRGLSNFLTWAFFLAEILAADLFFGKDSSAADALDDPSKHTPGDSHSSGDPSQPDDWKSAGDNAGPVDANHLWHSNGTPLDPHYSETAAMSALTGIGGHEPSLHGSAGGGGGGGGGGSSISFSPDLAAISHEPGEQAIPASEAGNSAENLNFFTLDAATAATLGLDLNSLQFELALGNGLLSGEPLDSMLDLKTLGLDLHVETGLLSGFVGHLGPTISEVLDNTLGSPVSHVIEEITGLNLLHPVDGLKSLLGTAEDDLGKTSGSLTDLPTLQSSHNLLSPVSDAVAGIVPDATHALSLGHLGDLPSGSSIVFPSLAASDVSHPNTLFSGGQYTDYNLALQTAHADSMSSGGAIQNLIGEASQVIGGATDDHGLPGSEATGHAVDAALTHLASADHELLRGLSI